VDAAFYAEQWQGATCSVLRDEFGSFVRGSDRWYAHCLDALTMEALACTDELLLAQQANAQRVWMESDCQELVKLWCAGENQHSSIVSILREIRELSTSSQEFKFSFISRNCNQVAHVLAK
jgi:hypothetical protein